MKLYTDTVSFQLSFLHPKSFTCLAVVAPELIMKFNLIVTSSNIDDLTIRLNFMINSGATTARHVKELGCKKER